MKVISIETSVGAAILADLTDLPIHPIGEIAKDWGLILWGRCDRTQALIVALGTAAEWVADWVPIQRTAIVVFSKKGGVSIGDRIEFDTSAVEALCPKCNSANYISNGASFLCKNCGRQWKKKSIRQRGRPKKIPATY